MNIIISSDAYYIIKNTEDAFFQYDDSVEKYDDDGDRTCYQLPHFITDRKNCFFFDTEEAATAFLNSEYVVIFSENFEDYTIAKITVKTTITLD